MNAGKPSFERSGQQRLLTRDHFQSGQQRRSPERYQKDLTDQSPFPFGKHKGVQMAEVPMSYYRWFLDQEWSVKWPKVRLYALQLLGLGQISNGAA